MPAEYLIGLVIQDTSNFVSEHVDFESSNCIEIVSISWCLIDIENRKTLCLDKSSVLPLKPFELDCREFETLKSSPVLEDFLLEFESKFTAIIGSLDQACIITEGSTPLRDLLHPEATRKNISLHKLFFTYFDLQKEYKKAFNKSGDVDSYTLNKISRSLGFGEFSSKRNLEDVKLISKVIYSLLEKDHKFMDPDIINDGYIEFPFPQLKRLRDENVVKIRGMPYEATHVQIAKFFAGLNISSGGILILLSRKSLKTGEALILFENEESCMLAFRRNKHHIASRYIEVLQANVRLFKELSYLYFPERAECTFESVARLRGLPFRCNQDDISDFIDQTSQVLQGSRGVLIIENDNGLPSGDAFVLFKHEDDLKNALKLDRTNLKERYIEIFKSNIGELLQVAYRQNIPIEFGNIIGLNANHKIRRELQFENDLNSDVFFESMGNENDCVRLRGLPYSATVDDILDFFSNLADDILPRGIHFVFNQKSQPTGECYVQMVSHTAAQFAAHLLHHRYLDNRYIEVYVSSNHNLQIKRYNSIGSQSTLIDRENVFHNDRFGPHLRYSVNFSSNMAEHSGYKLKLRGIPYKACKRDISSFFDEFGIEERDIIFLDEGHRSTGEAFVYFPTREKARRAIKEKNHKFIGQRYIEIFEVF